MTNFGEKIIAQFRASLDARSHETLNAALKQIVDTKKRGGKVMVVTGSGPNIHEGVTTLIAEMIHKGLIDAVSTSSAVISHEMNGSLDRIKRVDAQALGMDINSMPMGNLFEFTLMQESELNTLEREMVLDRELIGKDRLGVHPNRNTATVWISFNSLLAYVNHFGNRVEYISV